MEWSKEYLAEALGTTGRAVVEAGLVIAPEFEEENIHNFRVATKRLRALLRLTAAAQKDVDAGLPKKFRKLYSLSGAIRDAQLLLKRAAKAEPQVPEYMRWLEAGKAHAQQDFRDFYDSAIIIKIEKRLRKIEPQALPVAALQDFFAGHRADVERILRKGSLDEEDLHDIRKKVKDLQHVAKIAGAFWPEGVEAAGISGNLKSLEQLTERAGDFNDSHNALISIEAFLAENHGLEAAQNLREIWAAKKAKSREKLMDEIRQQAIDAPQED